MMLYFNNVLKYMANANLVISVTINAASSGDGFRPATCWCPQGDWTVDCITKMLKTTLALLHVPNEMMALWKGFTDSDDDCADQWVSLHEMNDRRDWWIICRKRSIYVNIYTLWHPCIMSLTILGWCRCCKGICISRRLSFTSQSWGIKSHSSFKAC